MGVIVEFTVYGKAVPQGSKKSMPIFKGGKPLMKNGRAITRVINDNPKLGEWRQCVAVEARQAYDGEPLPTDVPLRLTIVFTRPRPAAHYGTGKNASKLKATAPAYPTTRPDTLKLARAIEDALTGVVWRDDSQVVKHDLEKEWGNAHSCRVVVEEVDSPF